VSDSLSVRLGERIRETRLALMMLTRLPAGSFPLPPPPMTAARWAFPLTGLPVGLIGWAVLAGGSALGLAPLAAGVLALIAMALATGGLHHDGLADFIDGLGGRDRARRLEIMRDSRVGSYGALALILAVGLGAASLGALADESCSAAALLLAGVGSRFAMLLVLDGLPPARPDGLGRMATPGRPDRNAWLPGLAVLLLLGLITGVAGVLAVAAMLGTAALVARKARAALGGQTGDVLGATQLCAETAGWLVLSAAL